MYMISLALRTATARMQVHQQTTQIEIDAAPVKSPQPAHDGSSKQQSITHV
jgi:hypothetical protein